MAPPGSGTLDVRVSTFAGTSATSAADQFTYTPPPTAGYRLVASDGGIFAFGDAALLRLDRRPSTSTSPSWAWPPPPTATGYWLVASDGGIFTFGDARFYGSTGAIHLNKPIVGMAATPDGQGYWLVASDGGIFASATPASTARPAPSTSTSPSWAWPPPRRRGYWLVASDGGIFASATPRFYGSTGALTLNQPIVGMAATPDGRGYWLVASDGGIFSFGDAALLRLDRRPSHLNQPIVGMAATPTAGATGWWPPTAASSPSATPASTARPGHHPQPAHRGHGRHLVLSIRLPITRLGSTGSSFDMSRMLGL